MINVLIVAFEWASTLLFPLGQFARLSLYNQQVNLYVYELCMAVAAAFLVAKYGLAPFKKIKTSIFIMLFLSSLTISYLVSIRAYDTYANSVGLLYLFRLGFYFMHFLYLTYHLTVYKRAKKQLFLELASIVVILIVSSILQYLFYPNLRNLLYMGWDPHLYRVFGFFFEPYLAGAALGLSFFFVYFHGGGLKKKKYVVLAMLFILLMLTFSRTVYLAMFVSLLALLLTRKKIKYIALLLFAFVAVAYVIPKPVGVGVQLFRTFSIQTRFNNTLEGIAMWDKSPLFGTGYNRIRYAREKMGVVDAGDPSHAAATFHSSFITILVAGGIISFILFILLLVQMGRISTPATFYMFFLAVLSLGDNALLHTFMLFYYLKLLAYENAQSSLE